MVRRVALGCVEFAVPGDTLEDKLRILESHKMWLELVNDGFDKKRLKNILEMLPSFNTSIMSVQAYLLHNLRMLNASNENQKAAVRHVEETVKIAARVGAQNVVVAIYGKPTVSDPRGKCIEILKYLGKLGARLGVVISVEALGRHRSAFLPSVDEVCQLVDEVSLDHVRAMADTEHIYANGEDVAKTIKTRAAKLTEVHLRDTDSKPPGQGSIDFGPVLKVVREKFRGLTCLEYQPGLDSQADFTRALEATKVISAAR